MMQENPEQIRQSLEDLHKCSASLVQSVPVSESFEGKPAWEGVVHVFDLADHPKAKRAYAWSSPIEGSPKRRFFAVLHIPPVTGPQEAVKAAIVAEHKSSSMGWNEEAVSKALRNMPSRKDRE